MGQYREITKEITIVNAKKARVWDAPASSPLKSMTVVVSSAGAPTTAADIDSQVFYGGHWDGTPFDSDSTHLGGVGQGAAAALAAATEIAHIVYEDASILPSNVAGPTVKKDMKKYGLPIVLELTNNGAVPITLFVTFISESLAENV